MASGNPQSGSPGPSHAAEDESAEQDDHSKDAIQKRTEEEARQLRENNPGVDRK